MIELSRLQAGVVSYRHAMKLSQNAFAQKAGVFIDTLIRFEQFGGGRLDNLFWILQVAGLVDCRQHDWAEFRHNIRIYRESKDWTQRTLAAKAFVTPQGLNRIEQGKNVPQIRTAIKLCRALEVDLLEMWEK